MTTPKLSKEIALCLGVKIILLTLLWWICFSHPVSETQSAQGLTHILSNQTVLSLSSPNATQNL